MEVLLRKLFCAPALVVLSSLAGRRWGDGVTGLLVALPIVAGPILFVTYVQHGSSFAARAATASLLGLISLAFFTVVFVHVSRRTGWAMTIFACWVATLGADVGLSYLHVAATAALMLTVAATAFAMTLTPRAATTAAPSNLAGWPWWDLPGRAVATAALVVTVTSASSAVGPHWTGVLAPFPIATSVVAAFVLSQRGANSAATTVAGVLTGLFGFAAFCFCVAVLVHPLGRLAFGVAAGVTVPVQLLIMQVRGRCRSRSRILVVPHSHGQERPELR